MKKHKAWKTAVLLFVAAFFIIGPTGENFKDHIFIGIVSILVGVLIVAGVVLSWLSRLGVNISPRKAEKAEPAAAPTPAAAVRPTRTMRVSNSDTEEEGDAIVPSGTYRYEYSAVRLFRPEGECDPVPDVGSEIDLETEPENPYDSGAVKAVYGGGLVGYLNRGKLQDMMRDKDEVPSSNLGNSSKKACNFNGYRLFAFLGDFVPKAGHPQNTLNAFNSSGARGKNG